MRIIVPVLLLMVFGACSTSPETPRQRLAVAEVALTEVSKTLGDLADAGVLVGEPAGHAADLLVVARAAMDPWRANPDDPDAATAAESAIAALTAFLEVYENRADVNTNLRRAA